MDYGIKVIKEATATEPKIFEVTFYNKAIAVDGKEVMIQGQKVNTNLSLITKQVEQMESQLARMKSIKADMEK